MKGHPFELEALIRHALVLTYATPPEALHPLVSPGLELETYKGFGFFVVAMVDTNRLRKVGFSRRFGLSFLQADYRIFVKYRTPGGKSIRGMQSIRSEVNSKLMSFAGKSMSLHPYCHVPIASQVDTHRCRFRVGPADRPRLDVTGDLDSPSLPADSIFDDEATARRYSGMTPYIFDYDPRSESMLRVQGVRKDPYARLAAAEFAVPVPFTEFNLAPESPKLAGVFYFRNVPYRWKRGVSERAVMEDSLSNRTV